jgi:hypothetical protein
MSRSTVEAGFEVTSWDEQPFDEAVGVSKLTKASVQKSYSGDVEGTSATESLMAYHPDGSASFVGLERVKGKINGRSGTLVLQHVGEFRDGAAKASITVVGGTEEFRQTTGDGDFLADPAGSINLRLDG